MKALAHSLELRKVDDASIYLVGDTTTLQKVYKESPQCFGNLIDINVYLTSSLLLQEIVQYVQIRQKGEPSSVVEPTSRERSVKTEETLGDALIMKPCGTVGVSTNKRSMVMSREAPFRNTSFSYTFMPIRTKPRKITIGSENIRRNHLVLFLKPIISRSVIMLFVKTPGMNISKRKKWNCSHEFKKRFFQVADIES